MTVDDQNNTSSTTESDIRYQRRDLVVPDKDVEESFNERSDDEARAILRVIVSPQESSTSMRVTVLFDLEEERLKDRNRKFNRVLKDF